MKKGQEISVSLRTFASRRLMGVDGRLSPTANAHLNKKTASQFEMETLSPLTYFTVNHLTSRI
jgi:hypothetical protein